MCFLRSHTPAPPLDDFMNDDMDAYLIAMDTSIAPGPSDASPAAPPLPSHSKQPLASNHRTRLDMEEEEEETENSEGPPEKKVSRRKHFYLFLSVTNAACSKDLCGVYLNANFSS